MLDLHEKAAADISADALEEVEIDLSKRGPPLRPAIFGWTPETEAAYREKQAIEACAKRQMLDAASMGSKAGPGAFATSRIVREFLRCDLGHEPAYLRDVDDR